MESANIKTCSSCKASFSHETFKTCDNCRERSRQRRAQNRANEEPRQRGRKKQLPAAYISQMERFKPLDIGRMDKVCENCGAKHWEGELPSQCTRNNRFWMSCCQAGRIKIDFLKEPPQYIKELYLDEGSEGTHFKNNIRQFNSAFAFVSTGKPKPRSVGNDNSTSQFMPFQLHGAMYHYQAPLTAENEHEAKYAQLYFYDPEYAARLRYFENNNLSQQILEKLTECINNNNPYITLYKSAHELLNEVDVESGASVHITPQLELILVEGRDRRTENLPTASEVAAIIPNNNRTDIRDIRIYPRRDNSAAAGDSNYQNFTIISQNHGLYMPLHYVLLFPKGDLGWSWELRRLSENGTQVRLKQREFYRFRLHLRDSEFPAIFLAKRLFQQYLVDAWAVCDQNKLDWLKNNQSKLRADVYNGLEDALISDDTDYASIGRRYILPSSYVGGPRFMAKQYQNAMAIVRFLGKPSLFITFTANPKWDEITRELLPGQTAADRPDLVARVFNLKVRELIKELRYKNIFGKYKGHVRTVEYQKRGLPHIHLLLFLDQPDKPETRDKVDAIISACIPSKEKDAELYEVVTKNMIHGPCGELNPNSPCMVEDKNKKKVCSKQYPKKITEQTQIPLNGYPSYRRTATIEESSRYYIPNPLDRTQKLEITNEWVVPYNPYLSKKYKAHINVESCASVQAIKYINKYVYKGQDRSTLNISDSRDEINKYLQGRYISPVEAFWRLFEYPFHDEDPTVTVLPLHLPGQQPVYFKENSTEVEIREILNSSTTMLLAWFEYNSNKQDGHGYLYQEFPEHYTFDAENSRWKPRKRGFAIGRMQYCSPSAGERFYLRLLITVKKGAKSFDDLKTVDNHVCATFREACVRIGLVEGDNEWIHSFQEATLFQSGEGLRSLFVIALTHSQLASPKDLWNRFCFELCDDLEYKLNRLFPNQEYRTNTNIDSAIISSEDDRFFFDDECLDYGLYLIEKRLQELNSTLKQFDMPYFKFNWSSLIDNLSSQRSNSFLRAELEFNLDEERLLFEQNHNRMNTGQKVACDTIISSLNTPQIHSKCFFLQGPAGTGKTFVYNTLCHYVRSRGKIVCCVASSGIASLLLPNGRTSHFMFKIPIQIHAESSCFVKKNSDIAEFLRKTDLIIWDEVPMQHKHCFEAVDRCLKDIRSSNEMFGGVVIVLGGDFAQIAPVVKHGDRSQIVDASIRYSYIWSKCKVLNLTQNMRVQDNSTEANLFKTWLGQLSYNPFLRNCQIKIPPYLYRTNQLSDLINKVYPKDRLASSVLDPTLFTTSAILTSTNNSVNEINAAVLNEIPGESKILYSVDKCDVSNSEDTAGREEIFQISTDYLQTLNPSNFPPSRLELKKGVVVMLLRNLNVKEGLCNGTRLIVKEIGKFILKVALLNPNNTNGPEVIHLIPRITLSTLEGELPFILTRKQFPVRLCFAMTINKSQGQSLETVGIDLRFPVFTHGQLYVAFSRSKSYQKISVLLNDDNDQEMVDNIVYPELLI